MQFYEYLQSYEDYFWQWQEDAEVTAIPGGSTIAYRDYLQEILSLLSDQGLPPFGALLLAMIATNTTMDDGISRVETLLHKKQERYDGESMEAVISFLRILEQLPAAFKEGAKRIQVFQVLFENCHKGLGLKNSKEIVSDIKRFSQQHKGNLVAKLNNTLPYSRAVFQKDCRAIELLHRRFSGTVDIINAVAGLPELDTDIVELERPETPDAEPSFSENFVEELLADNKTFQVGALIRRIWSGLNIPFHHTVPSQQPLGGVSDLTNKGDFDRLIISEFANDDMVFLSRLANNEALYLQREIPPAHNDQERVLLVDVSIRNWGTPKLMAFAVALAIARHPKTDIGCRIFCVGNHCTPAPSDNLTQLADSLMQVSEGLHAAAGLQQFFAEYEGAKKPELFFISTAGSMAYPAVQKVINDHYTWFRYWVNVDQNGSIDLFRNQHGSKKFIQHIQLPLETLWEKPPQPVRQQQSAETQGLPDEYPLLFPQTGKYKKLLNAGNDFDLLIDKENRLFRFYKNTGSHTKKGLELLPGDLPAKSTHFAAGQDKSGRLLLLCFKSNSKEVVLVDIQTRQQTNLFFDAWKPNGYDDFFFYSNAFYFRTWTGCWSLECDAKMNIHWQDEVASGVAAAYDQLSHTVRRLTADVSDFGSVLKNVTSVFVNHAGNLVVGKHELVIRNNVIKFVLERGSVKFNAVHAEARVAGQEFVFPCGSTVVINRSGMMVLTSGTAEGQGLYNVLLENAGERKLHVIQKIINATGYDLALARDKATVTPSIINGSVSMQEAKRIADMLTEHGATVSVVPATTAKHIFVPLILESSLGVATDKFFTGNNLYYADNAAKPLEVIPTATFFEKNIRAYTRYITDYGA